MGMAEARSAEAATSQLPVGAAPSVTVRFMSGEVMDVAGLPEYVLASHLCDHLLSARPLSQGKRYQLLTDDARVLGESDKLIDNCFTAVVRESFRWGRWDNADMLVR